MALQSVGQTVSFKHATVGKLYYFETLRFKILIQRLYTLAETDWIFQLPHRVLEQRCIILFMDYSSRDAPHFYKLVIKCCHLAGLVNHEDAVSRRLEGCAQYRIAARQVRRSLFTLGDVMKASQHSYSTFELTYLCVNFAPDCLSISPQKARFVLMV